MKKRALIFIVLALFLISFVSAGWFYDMWGKITGFAIGGDGTGYMDERPHVIWTLEDSENTLNFEGGHQEWEEDWFREGRDYGYTGWSKIKMEPPLKLIYPLVKGFFHNNSIGSSFTGESGVSVYDLKTGNQKYTKLYCDGGAHCPTSFSLHNNSIYTTRVDYFSSKVNLDNSDDFVNDIGVGGANGNHMTIYKDVLFMGGHGNPCTYNFSTVANPNFNDSELLWCRKFVPKIVYKDIANLGVEWANISSGVPIWRFYNEGDGAGYTNLGKIVYKNRAYSVLPDYFYVLDAKNGKIIYQKEFPGLRELKGGLKTIYKDGIFGYTVEQTKPLPNREYRIKAFKLSKSGDIIWEKELIDSPYTGSFNVIYPILVGDILLTNYEIGDNSRAIRDQKTFDKIGEIEKGNVDHHTLGYYASNGYLSSSEDIFTPFFPQAIADNGLEKIHVYVDEDLHLDASKSYDRFGTITSYEWKVNGQTFSGTSPTASTSIPTAGEYRAVLKICDDRGYCDSDTVDIVVHEDLAPEISNIYVDEIKDTSVIVKFESDKLLVGAEVVVGENYVVDIESYELTETGIEYSVLISGLTSGQRYNFNIVAKDLQEKETTTEMFYFWTSVGKEFLVLQNGVFPDASSNLIEDTFIRDDVPESIAYSSENFWFGEGGGTFGLMKFNLDSIPYGSFFEKAELRLNKLPYSAGVVNFDVRFNKINKNVDLSKVSFKYSNSDTQDSWSGREYFDGPVFGTDINAKAHTINSGDDPEIIDLDVTSLLLDDLFGSNHKLGIYLYHDGGTVRCRSSEHPEINKRPKLSLDYYPGHRETSVSDISPPEIRFDSEKTIITWKTNKPVTTKFSFGIGELDRTLTDEHFKFSHKIVIPYLLKGRNYQYEIEAENSGNYLSQSSGSFIVPIKTSMPETPLNLQVYALTEFEKTLLLKWDLQDKVDGYKIYRSEDGINFDLIAEVGVRDVYQDLEVEQDKTYYYKIKGINENNGESEFSNVVSAIAYAPGPSAIQDLSGISSFIMGYDPQKGISYLAPRIKLSWTVPEEELPKEYDLRVSTNPITEENFFDAVKYNRTHLCFPSPNDPVLTPGHLNPGEIQELDFCGLEEGETYYFSIKSIGENDAYSEISNILQISTIQGDQAYVDDIKIIPNYIITHMGGYNGLWSMYREGNTGTWIRSDAVLFESFVMNYFGDPSWVATGGRLDDTDGVVNNYVAGTEQGIFSIYLNKNAMHYSIPVVIEEADYSGSAPVFSNIVTEFELNVGQEWTLPIEVTDLDGDAIQLLTTTLPEGMQLIDQTLTWTPNKEFIDETISIIAYDGHVATALDLTFDVSGVCVPLTPADKDCNQCVSSIELLQYMVRWKNEYNTPGCNTNPDCVDSISLLQGMVTWKETYAGCV